MGLVSGPTQAVLTVKVAEPVYRSVRGRAEAAGCSVSEWLRVVILAELMRSPVEAAMAAPGGGSLYRPFEGSPSPDPLPPETFAAGLDATRSELRGAPG